VWRGLRRILLVLVAAVLVWLALVALATYEWHQWSAGNHCVQIRKALATSRDPAVLAEAERCASGPEAWTERVPTR
jgi:hypothetical protein